jgi:hypothetical protein
MNSRYQVIWLSKEIIPRKVSIKRDLNAIFTKQGSIKGGMYSVIIKVLENRLSMSIYNRRRTREIYERVDN